MKRQIRTNVFETNSSSTHAICIPKRKLRSLEESATPEYYEIPLQFECNNFGWEFDIYSTPEGKASYLYTAICDFYEGKKREKALLKLGKILDSYGVKYDFTTPDDKDLPCVDHYYELRPFVNSMLRSKRKLLTYLFGDSFVVTGNDNREDFDEYMCKPNGNLDLREYHYEWKDEFDDYEIYYKGN